MDVSGRFGTPPADTVGKLWETNRRQLRHQPRTPRQPPQKKEQPGRGLRSLEQQAAQESTITGVLLDLGERGLPVTVKTAGRHSCHGQIVAVGADFVLVCDNNNDQLLIPTAAIATISTSPAQRRVTGARLRPSVVLAETLHGPSVVLAETLHELAADQAQVEVVVADECVSGLLKMAGTDVIAVTVDQPRDDQVHVATAAIDHLVVLAR